MSECTHRSGLYRQTLLPFDAVVAADVEGLRAILAEALTNGIRLGRSLSAEHHAAIIAGELVSHDSLATLDRGIGDVVGATSAGLQLNFPQHMSDRSPARETFLFLAEWAVLTGLYAYRNVAAEARKRGTDPRRNGVTLPPDPRWLADAVDTLLAATLPALQVLEVPVPGTVEFLSGRR